MKLDFIHLMDVNVKRTKPQAVRAQNSLCLVAMLQDQSRAVVLFNRGKMEAPITAPFETLGVPPTSNMRIRDIWKRKEIGQFTTFFSAIVPTHGVVMVRILPVDVQK
jgi:alpha-galactosidase